MLIPDLLNILFDQSDYGALLVLRSVHRRKTVYARKYSLLCFYGKNEKSVKNLCIVGQIKAIKCIIDKVNIHAGNENMLHWSLGHLELSKYLVAVGANIHAANEYALRHCAEHGHMSVLKYLVSIGANVNLYDYGALLWSAAGGHLDVTKYLVSVGADVHMCDDSLLICCSKRNQLETAKYLVSIGANVNGYQPKGALYWSVHYDYLNMAKYLTSVGANIDDTVFVALAFETCVEHNYVKMLKWLIESGADIHVKDDFVLRECTRRGQFDMVKYLVEAGANIRAHNDYALKWSKKNGHMRLHDYLMSKINDNMQQNILSYLFNEKNDISIV